MPSAPPSASALAPGSRRWLPFLLTALAILGLLIWKPPFVIRPLPNTKPGNTAAVAVPAANAATAFIDPIWNSKIVPAFIEKAVDAKELLAAIQENPDNAGEKYGRREATNPYNYLIKGSGQVTAVNTESRAGTLTIDYAGVSKEMNARAIREALGGKDPASLNGKQIRFVGAFTYDPHSAGNIRITPIKLEIQGPG